MSHLMPVFNRLAVAFASGQGVWLTDVNGKQYLDGVSSLWCNVHGHRHPRLVAAAHLLGPVMAGDPLADEPALQIREGDEHGVDRAARDLLLELGGRQRALGHRGMVDRGRGYSGVT